MRIPIPSFFIGAMVCVALPHLAYAQAARTFVSSNGSDGNDCSRQAPCRSFATAITKTAAGGEINTLDPGGYGAVTITKSISIVSGLGEAGVLVPAGGTGITIDAGPTDQINLRGLAIEGAGLGKTGIFFKAGGSLVISQSVVRNVTDNAIDLEPSTASGIHITDTLVTENGRVGIYLYPQGSSGAIKAWISRASVFHNQWGIYVNGNASAINTIPLKVSIIDSNVTYNTKGVGYGIYGNGGVTNAANANSYIYVANTNVSYNTMGFVSDATYADLNGVRIEQNIYNDITCNMRYPTFVRSYKNNILGTGSCTINALTLD